MAAEVFWYLMWPAFAILIYVLPLARRDYFFWRLGSWTAYAIAHPPLFFVDMTPRPVPLSPGVASIELSRGDGLWITLQTYTPLPTTQALGNITLMGIALRCGEQIYKRVTWEDGYHVVEYVTLGPDMNANLGMLLRTDHDRVPPYRHPMKHPGDVFLDSCGMTIDEYRARVGLPPLDRIAPPAMPKPGGGEEVKG